jgi:quercetin dioxygenase-like cupin family protein
VRANHLSAAQSETGFLIQPESLERLDLLGPTIQFVTDPDKENGPCIMRGTVPPGVSIPLHSHADPETFLPLSGRLRGLTFHGDDHEWIDIRPGVIFHVPGGAKHAFRNDGREEAVMLIASTTRIGRFFRELGVPVAPGLPPVGSPSPDRMQRFLATSARYGYWNASPEENVRVGITLPF